MSEPNRGSARRAERGSADQRPDPESLVPEKLERLAAGIEITAKGYMSEARASRFRDAILALDRKR